MTIPVVSQAYDVKFWEEYVLRGNAAILKCQIPSFVSEYVSVSSWIVSEDKNEEEVGLDSSENLGISSNRSTFVFRLDSLSPNIISRLILLFSSLELSIVFVVRRS